jgi:hypothetical protein
MEGISESDKYHKKLHKKYSVSMCASTVERLLENYCVKALQDYSEEDKFYSQI